MDHSSIPSTPSPSNRRVNPDTRPLAPPPETPPVVRQLTPYPYTPQSLGKRSFDKHSDLAAENKASFGVKPGTYCPTCRRPRLPKLPSTTVSKLFPSTCIYCQIIRHCEHDPFAALDELWSHFDGVVFVWDVHRRELDRFLLEARDKAYQMIKAKVATMLSDTQPGSFHYKVPSLTAFFKAAAIRYERDMRDRMTQYAQLSIHNEGTALLGTSRDASKQFRLSVVIPTLSTKEWEAKRTTALERFHRWCKDSGDWVEPVAGTGCEKTADPWDSDGFDDNDLFDDIVFKDLCESSPSPSLRPQPRINDETASEGHTPGDIYGADDPNSPSNQLIMDVPESPPSEPVLPRSPYGTRSKKRRCDIEP